MLDSAWPILWLTSTEMWPTSPISSLEETQRSNFGQVFENSDPSELTQEQYWPRKITPSIESAYLRMCTWEEDCLGRDLRKVKSFRLLQTKHLCNSCKMPWMHSVFSFYSFLSVHFCTSKLLIFVWNKRVLTLFIEGKPFHFCFCVCNI